MPDAPISSPAVGNVEGAERKSRCPYTPRDHDLANLMDRHEGDDGACAGLTDEPMAEAGE